MHLLSSTWNEGASPLMLQAWPRLAAVAMATAALAVTKVGLAIPAGVIPLVPNTTSVEPLAQRRYAGSVVPNGNEDALNDKDIGLIKSVFIDGVMSFTSFRQSWPALLRVSAKVWQVIAGWSSELIMEKLSSLKCLLEDHLRARCDRGSAGQMIEGKQVSAEGIANYCARFETDQHRPCVIPHTVGIS